MKMREEKCETLEELVPDKYESMQMHMHMVMIMIQTMMMTMSEQ